MVCRINNDEGIILSIIEMVISGEMMLESVDLVGFGMSYCIVLKLFLLQNNQRTRGFHNNEYVCVNDLSQDLWPSAHCFCLADLNSPSS